MLDLRRLSVAAGLSAALSLAGCAAPIASDPGAGTAGGKGEQDETPGPTDVRFVELGGSCASQDVVCAGGSCFQDVCVPTLGICQMELLYVQKIDGRFEGRVLVDPALTSVGYQPRMNIATEEIEGMQRPSSVPVTLTSAPGKVRGFDVYSFAVAAESLPQPDPEDDFLLTDLFVVDRAGDVSFVVKDDFDLGSVFYSDDRDACLAPDGRSISATVEGALADAGSQRLTAWVGAGGADPYYVVPEGAERLRLEVLTGFQPTVLSLRVGSISYSLERHPERHYEHSIDICALMPSQIPRDVIVHVGEGSGGPELTYGLAFYDVPRRCDNDVDVDDFDA